MADHALDDDIKQPDGVKEQLQHPPHRAVGNGPRDIGREIAGGADQVDRFEQFILGAGEFKIEAVIDTRMPNAYWYKFNKEDHTLGNLLRSELLKDSRVIFSGYKVPHPSFPSFELRIETDGSVTCKDALEFACDGILRDLVIFEQEFTKEVELRKMADDGHENGNGAGAAGAA